MSDPTKNVCSVNFPFILPPGLLQMLNSTAWDRPRGRIA